MYTQRSPYLYPGACASGGYFRSVRARLPTSLSRPRRARHLLVFVLVALPPPPVYVLDNEARPKSSGVATRRLIKSSRAPSRFYPRGLRRSLPTISLRQAFRLQREASMAVELTACYCPRTSCHHSRSPILSLVTIPLRIATGGGLYARRADVSRGFLKYFSERFSLSFSPFRLMR